MEITVTQNVLTCFKFITIINIINYVIIKNTFIINYLLICTLIGIFYIVLDSNNNNKLNILTDNIDILSLLVFTSIINILYIINIKITNLKYIIFISLSYIIIKYINKKKTS